MVMTHSEAGKLGYQKAHLDDFIKSRFEKVYEAYIKNPPVCLQCGKTLPFNKRRNKFCDHHCSATFNNSKREINNKTKGKRYCIVCGTELERYDTKYCSNKCHKDNQWKLNCEKIEANNGFPWLNCGSNSHPVRKYLIYKRGHKCEVCGLTEWMGQPTPLVLDHINGNGSNWSLDNLRLVCPNCDAQLPTYKSKNRNSNRIERRKRAFIEYQLTEQLSVEGEI